MKGPWQAMVMTSLLAPCLWALELPEGQDWKRLRVVKSEFSRKVGLMDNERDRYATALTAIAVKDLIREKGSQEALERGRKLLALALHLSPRNKKAVIANAKLARREIPDAIELEYSKQGLARLFMTRSAVLEKQGGEENTRLSHYLIHVTSLLDPNNEDAIYLNEVRRLDHGALDWSRLTDPPERAR